MKSKYIVLGLIVLAIFVIAIFTIVITIRMNRSDNRVDQTGLEIQMRNNSNTEEDKAENNTNNSEEDELQSSLIEIEALINEINPESDFSDFGDLQY